MVLSIFFFSFYWWFYRTRNSDLCQSLNLGKFVIMPLCSFSISLKRAVPSFQVKYRRMTIWTTSSQEQSKVSFAKGHIYCSEKKINILVFFWVKTNQRWIAKRLNSLICCHSSNEYNNKNLCWFLLRCIFLLLALLLSLFCLTPKKRIIYAIIPFSI